MNAMKPVVGQWYRGVTNELFEVVAIDDQDETIEIQYFDGTVEEMDTEDWRSQWADREIETAEPPEDFTGSMDVESTDDSASGSDISGDESGLRAGAADGMDYLFE